MKLKKEISYWTYIFLNLTLTLSLIKLTIRLALDVLFSTKNAEI